MIRTRHTGLAAALVALFALIILGALQSVIWNGLTAPAVVRAFAALFEPALASQPPSSMLGQPTELYFGYGRLVLGAYALLLFAGWEARDLLPRPARLLLLGTSLMAVSGDVIAYWLSESRGPAVRAIGFWYLELPAVAAACLTLTGVGVLHARRKAAGAALLFALPLALTATATLRYLPHGVLLGIAAALTAALASTPPLRARSAVAPVALLLLGSAGLAVPYRPTLVLGPPSTWTGPLAHGPTLRLHVFNTGFNRMGALLVGRERPWRPAPAFVLEHPTRGLVAFDTGLPDGATELHWPLSWLMETRADDAHTLPRQMRLARLDPADVRWVVISHLHHDHVGQLAAFPNAQFIGGPGTAAFAAAHRLASRWTEQNERSVDFFGDGSLWLLHGGGHSREDLLAQFAVPSAQVLLTGDSVVHRDWLESLDVQRIATSPARAAEVRNQVRAFLQSSAAPIAIFGHDLDGVPCGDAGIVCHQPWQ